MFKVAIAASVAAVASAGRFHFKAWNPRGKLSECQGDCDSNRNCGAGLHCQHENRKTGHVGHVNGCSGKTKRLADYCVRENDSAALTYFGWSPSGKLGDCQGDCDSNRNCRKGLVCAHENRKTGRVNGARFHCNGKGGHLVDYCVDGRPFFNFKGWNPRAKLGHCEGDCDSNRHCKGGLECQHENSKTHHVANKQCAGGTRAYADYCVVPSRPHFTWKGWTPRSKLNECEGDCDRDSHCKRGLRCAHINNGRLRGHGCKGIGRRWADYCVKAFRLKLTFLGWSPKNKLNKCQGDCDSNSNCMAGFKCVHDKAPSHRVRSSQCAGTGKGYADYCI